MAASVIPLLGLLLSGCGLQTGTGSSVASTPQTDSVALQMCRNSQVSTTVTKDAPVGAQQSLYVAASDHLYAVNARNGAVRWCQQVKLTRQFRCPSDARGCPPPVGMRFGTPRVTNGVLYSCASAGSGDTFAFNAGDGSRRWRARTDCWIVDIPFEDNAVPLVKDGIVYDGTYALRQQDGTVLWRTAIDTQIEGALSLQALVGDTLYANTENYVFAINASNGKVLWRYRPDTLMPIGGALVVAGRVLYAGTLGSVDHPEESRFYALDADTGKLRWQYQMGDYQGAVIHNDSIYISSGDQHLYVLDKNTGKLLWQYKFSNGGYNMAPIANNVLYISSDGAYALNSADGTVLWHKDLGSNPSVSFTPPIVLEGGVYLASIDGSGHSILYALNASNGAEYWHSHIPYQIAPLAVGQ